MRFFIKTNNFPLRHSYSANIDHWPTVYINWQKKNIKLPWNLNSSNSVSSNSPDHLCLHKLIPSHKTIPGKEPQVLVTFGHWIYTQTNPKYCNGKLPLGSMGFPIIRETIEFFSPYSLHDIPPFCQEKNGNIYITAILNILLFLEEQYWIFWFS